MFITVVVFVCVYIMITTSVGFINGEHNKNIHSPSDFLTSFCATSLNCDLSSLHIFC